MFASCLVLLAFPQHSPGKAVVGLLTWMERYEEKKKEKKREKQLEGGWMCEEEATAGHSFLLGIKHSSRFLSVMRIFLWDVTSYPHITLQTHLAVSQRMPNVQQTSMS